MNAFPLQKIQTPEKYTEQEREFRA